MVVEPTVTDDVHRLIPLILTRLVNSQMSVEITITSADLSTRDKHFIRIPRVKRDLQANLPTRVAEGAEGLLEGG